MGPVVAVAYGETISDRRLVFQALKAECFSLLWCICVGAIIGGAAGWVRTGSFSCETSFVGRVIKQPVLLTHRACWLGFYFSLCIVDSNGRKLA